LQSRSADALPIVQSIPESYVRRYGLALVYQALGRKAEADAALQELLAKDSEVAPVEIANVFAMRGDSPAALDWLQQDYDRKLYGIMIAKTSPLLRSLAHEPRFIALMQKVVPNQ
jgi:predicted Zn-dependent protease